MLAASAQTQSITTTQSQPDDKVVVGINLVSPVSIGIVDEIHESATEKTRVCSFGHSGSGSSSVRETERSIFAVAKRSDRGRDVEVAKPLLVLQGVPLLAGKARDRCNTRRNYHVELNPLRVVDFPAWVRNVTQKHSRKSIISTANTSQSNGMFFALSAVGIVNY